MTRCGIPSLVLVGILVTSLPARAAESPLEAIPDSAGAVIRLKNPQTTIRKVVNFAKQVDPRFAQQARQWNQMIGVPILNPTLAGVDQKHDWWFAVFPTAEGKPSLAFVIPTTNADAMRTALAGQFQFVEHGKWLFYTKDAPTAKKIRDHVAGKGKSIGSVIDAESNAVMGRGDLSVYVNVAQIREMYKDQLEAAQTEIDATLKELSSLTPEVPGLNLEPVFEMYGQMLRGLLQAANDTEGFTLALGVKTRSIEIEEYLKVTGDSPTDKFLQSHAPSEMKTLAKLPAEKLAYFGLHGDFKALTDWGMKFTMAMFKKDDEESKQINESLAEMKKLEFGSYLASIGLGDLKTGLLRMAVVTEAKPADKMRDVTRKMSTAMAKMSFSGIKQEVELKIDAEKIGEHSADILIVKQEISPELDPAGMQQRFVDAMYGPEGMTTRIVYLPDMVVQTMGGGKAAMTEVLNALEGGKSGAGSRTRRALHQTTRSQLLEKANLLVLVDLPGLVADTLNLVLKGGQLPIPIDAETIKQLKLRRSYLGFALATEPQGVRTKTRIPIGQVEGFVKLFSAFQNLGQKPQF